MQPFGQYRIAASIAQGGMAELLLALQQSAPGFSKVVALKRILSGFERAPEYVRMFLEEARLVARLDHPNIVRVHDFGQIEARHYLAMEYLPGEDVGKIIRFCRKQRVPLPVDIVVAIIQAVASGLHYAHGLLDTEGRPMNIIHRDVNPSNIVVTYQGAVKLLDFGIAKAVGGSSGTRTGVVKGKLAYLAPDQFMGHIPDQRLDVFCLGIVMWELLTGERLFQGATEAATIASVVQCSVPDLRSRVPTISDELAGICHTALRRHAGDRFQTAGQMEQALEAYLLNGGMRASSLRIGQWLESVCGSERARAKLDVAMGTNLARALPLVMTMLEHKRLATPVSGVDGGRVPDFGVTPLSRSDLLVAVPSSASSGALVEPVSPGALGFQGGRRRSRRLTVALAGVVASLLCALLVYDLTKKVPSRRSSKAALTRPAEVTFKVESEPSGAAVLLDGESTGKTTPTVIPGPGPGRSTTVRLEIPGYDPETFEISGEQAEGLVRRVVLKRRAGRIQITDLPPGAVLLVDGDAVGSKSEVDLSLGSHTLAVRVNQRVVNTKKIEVAPGVTSIKLMSGQ
jgi:serine/threonine protein kinase